MSRLLRSCPTPECPGLPEWICASMRQRALTYFCASCAAQMAASGKWLVLIPTEKLALSA